MATPIDDILSAFSQVHGTESEKLEWLRQRLATFSEELAADIEGKLVEEPTFVGVQYNKALKEAAAIARGALPPK
ncbi:hypothetical protein SAMN05444161_6790 [Rhizobiales bacterium GAS191]|nr:hypothetical protein SAMN05519103_06355 [Rhizobiales bacterium GAS113]SEE70639.1 hypothetical protein SAMN05444161_6790 [Rhizobiales bacterium GAS191]